jgi:hypothetical protein
LLAAIRVLWEVKTKIRSDDPRGVLEMALVLVTEAFTKGKDIIPKVMAMAVPAPSTEEVQTPRRMSLSDLQRFAPAASV